MTIQMPTIFVCVYYGTIIIINFFEVAHINRSKKYQEKKCSILSKNTITFLSEAVFFGLILVMSIYYSDLELGVNRARAFSDLLYFFIFASLIFQTITLWMTVLRPMKRIMDAYKGILPPGRKAMKAELYRIKMTTKFKKLVTFKITLKIQLTDNLFSFELNEKNMYKAGKYIVEESGQQLCDICFKNEPSCLLIPCLHGGICKVCYQMITNSKRQCPFCRAVTILLSFLGNPKSLPIPLSRERQIYLLQSTDRLSIQLTQFPGSVKPIELPQSLNSLNIKFKNF